jgi:hypothetical protein
VIKEKFAYLQFNSVCLAVQKIVNDLLGFIKILLPTDLERTKCNYEIKVA